MSESSPPERPPAPPGPYGGPPQPGWLPPVDHPSATTVLILGILGFAVCQAISPFAWVMGARAKREIDESQGRLGGRQQVVIGYVLGIVGSILLALVVLGGIAYVVVAAVVLSASSA